MREYAWVVWIVFIIGSVLGCQQQSDSRLTQATNDDQSAVKKPISNADASGSWSNAEIWPRRVDLDKLAHSDPGIALEELQFAVSEDAYNEILLAWLCSRSPTVRKAALAHLLSFETADKTIFSEIIKSIHRDYRDRLIEIDTVDVQVKEVRTEPGDSAQ